MTKRNEDADLHLDPTIGTHDVFISHRGLIMKRGFANHLYHSLKRSGIKAFLDMEELPEGDDVRPFMLEAARRAIIQVPIFTKIYAESTWCLDEVVAIMKSTKGPNNAKVLPVFFDVKSEELRNKDGPFAEAIKAHRSKGKRDEQTIKGWEDALKDASWREGFRLETYNGCEGELITELVEKISQEIQERTAKEGVIPNAVGLEERVRDVVNKLLHLKEHSNVNNVFFLVLWGMGGIGKTTLARAIFDRLRKEFEATSFVESCEGEKSNLQDSLFNHLLKKDFKGYPREGRDLLKRGLSGKKVLIVLDDVKEFESIDKVIDLPCLHHGSLILVTSRSRGVLLTLETSDVFKGLCLEVEGMVSHESLELLCLHAFKKRYAEPGFEELAQEYSDACRGLPLALEVLGSSLHKKSGLYGNTKEKKKVWADAIKTIKSSPNQKIEDRLKISYEDLAPHEKEMFLDVACLLIGEDKRSAECFWDGVFTESFAALGTLEDLCLVKVVKSERQKVFRKRECLTMHDHLRDLGRAIVEKEYEKGKWSRVWNNDVLSRVLQTKQGLDQIRGISTSLSSLSVGSLSQMRSLRLLFLDNTGLDGDDEGLEGLNIKWLKLTYNDGAPKELFGMKSLTVLTLREGTK